MNLFRKRYLKFLLIIYDIGLFRYNEFLRLTICQAHIDIYVQEKSSEETLVEPIVEVKSDLIRRKLEEDSSEEFEDEVFTVVT